MDAVGSGYFRKNKFVNKDDIFIGVQNLLYIVTQATFLKGDYP